jgi:hypothetical protein
MHAEFLAALRPTGCGHHRLALFPYELLGAAMRLVSIPSERECATAALLEASRFAPLLVVRSLLIAIVLDRG